MERQKEKEEGNTGRKDDKGKEWEGARKEGRNRKGKG